MGEFASDALCVTFLVTNHYDTGAAPWQGMFYHNTTTGGYRIWTGTVWDDLGAGFGGLITGIKYVTKNGNDTTGDGSSSNPYLTIAKGITETGVGGRVLIGPGTYTETLPIVSSVSLDEMVKGSVTISNTVAGGAVITVTPTLTDIVLRVSCSVINLSAATPADIAIHLNNVLGTQSALVIVDGADTLSGGALGQAIRVTGDNAAQTELSQVIVENVDHVIGAIAIILEAPTDFVRFNHCIYEGGNTAWIDISGPDGDVIIANCLQSAAAAAETIDYGLGTATGCNLHIGSSVLAGELEMNSNDGTGVVQLSAEAHLGRITALLADQIYRILLGGDKIAIIMLNISLAAGATHTMFTVPANQVFQAYAVRTVNRGGDTAGTLNYQYNGSGAASIVGAVGVAALIDGCTNNAVTAENVAATGTIQFQSTAVGGAFFCDAHVEGYLKAV